MRLSKARVKCYRSIRDTGWFDVENEKTILVGPNEAGKTVLLEALQQINPPDGIAGFDALRDYPRSEYNDITTGKVNPSDVTVVEVHFALEDGDRGALPDGFKDCVYVRGRKLDNKAFHNLQGGPQVATYTEIAKDLTRLCAHIDPRVPKDQAETQTPSAQLAAITKDWVASTSIKGDRSAALKKWLNEILPFISETNSREESRHDRLLRTIQVAEERARALDTLGGRLPVFVLFNNYFRVRPLIHLGHLAKRIETKILDDEQYDYGNECLLRLLGFTAQELSDLGNTTEPAAGDASALQNYRDQLNKRSYQLNAASVRLTEEIRRVWLPGLDRDEAERLRVQADRQYLKVVVEDELGVEIELDQRSEGFQWLV